MAPPTSPPSSPVYDAPASAGGFKALLLIWMPLLSGLPRPGGPIRMICSFTAASVGGLRNLVDFSLSEQASGRGSVVGDQRAASSRCSLSAAEISNLQAGNAALYLVQIDRLNGQHHRREGDTCAAGTNAGPCFSVLDRVH